MTSSICCHLRREGAKSVVFSRCRDGELNPLSFIYGLASVYLFTSLVCDDINCTFCRLKLVYKGLYYEFMQLQTSCVQVPSGGLLKHKLKLQDKYDWACFGCLQWCLSVNISD